MKKQYLLFTLFFILLFQACQKDDLNKNKKNPELQYGLGFSGDENLDTIPSTVNFGFGNDNLPTSYDITDKFPPIGDQGQYGTCVAWAVAYNAYTALNGMDKNYDQADLAKPIHQFSPKDLFTSIPDNKKGLNCNGTNFSSALTVLQSRGVATLATVPYENVGNCAQATADPSWAQEAGKHKIKYFRKIDGTVESIKKNISNNIPVIFGAELSDNFMTWNSDNVLSSNTTYNQVGQHAGHAMVICGYDDSKGPNGAFKVVNSWGPQWGSKGYIWIDYQFFLGEFVFNDNGKSCLFITEAIGKDNNVPDGNNDTTSIAGVDLAPWVFSDYSTFDNSGIENERRVEFNLYNIGNQAAPSSTPYELYYIYYNAYDANDYGILFYDSFDESVAAGTFQCPTADHCVFNVTINGNNNLSNVLFGNDAGLYRQYYVPQITGEYYFLMIVDATDTYQEEDEINNFFYSTLYPVYIENGYALSPTGSGGTLLEDNNLAVDRADLRSNKSFHKTLKNNSYTRKEIMALLQAEKKSGQLARKLNHFRKRGDKIYKQVK